MNTEQNLFYEYLCKDFEVATLILQYSIINCDDTTFKSTIETVYRSKNSRDKGPILLVTLIYLYYVSFYQVQFIDNKISKAASNLKSFIDFIIVNDSDPSKVIRVVDIFKDIPLILEDLNKVIEYFYSHKIAFDVSLAGTNWLQQNRKIIDIILFILMTFYESSTPVLNSIDIHILAEFKLRQKINGLIDDKLKPEYDKFNIWVHQPDRTKLGNLDLLNFLNPTLNSPTYTVSESSEADCSPMKN